MSKSKNPPKTPDALSGNVNDFFNAINHDNDLACVLVTVNYLDQCLAALLRGFFAKTPTTCDKILDLGQPLSTFSSRAMLAYCLDLIGSVTLTNLNHIGEIRNLFAHSQPELTFDDSDVQRLCSCLRFPSMQGLIIALNATGSTMTTPLTQEAYESQYQEPKRRFTCIASQLGMDLLIKSHRVNRCEELAKFKKD